MVGGMFYFGRRLAYLISSKPSLTDITSCYIVMVISSGYFTDLYLSQLISLLFIKLLGVVYVFGGLVLIKEMYDRKYQLFSPINNNKYYLINAVWFFDL